MRTTLFSQYEKEGCGARSTARTFCSDNATKAQNIVSKYIANQRLERKHGNKQKRK
jgi:hypothetical protein